MGQHEWKFSSRVQGPSQRPPRENFHRAIEEFNKILEFSPRDKEPTGWATTIANLAYAYEGLAGVENLPENLQRSVQYCEQALQVFTRDEHPREWAHTQNLLGNIYLQLASGTPAENIEEAIRCYQSAWKCTHEKMPGRSGHSRR